MVDVADAVVVLVELVAVVLLDTVDEVRAARHALIEEHPARTRRRVNSLCSLER